MTCASCSHIRDALYEYTVTHYMYSTQWHTTCTVHSDTLHVQYTVTHYIYSTQWHTACTVHSDTLHIQYTVTHYMYSTQWHTTCTVHSDTLHVQYTVTHYMYSTQWHTTCTVHSDTLHVQYTVTHCMYSTHGDGLRVKCRVALRCTLKEDQQTSKHTFEFYERTDNICTVLEITITLPSPLHWDIPGQIGGPCMRKFYFQMFFSAPLGMPPQICK